MHYFRNFKSFKLGALELFHPVTLLIGKNGSGKTNSLEAVELLAHLANGLPLFEIADVGRGGRAYEVRGGLRGCVKAAEGGFVLGFSGMINFEGPKVFQYEISVAASEEFRISEEFLTVGERKIFSAKSAVNPEILEVTYDNFTRGKQKPIASISSDRSALSRYSSFTVFPPTSNEMRRGAAQSVVNGIRKYLNSAFVFDPSSKAMRSYEPIGQAQLRRDGSNLSSVLFYLSKGEFVEQGVLERILERLKTIPEEPFVGFEFIETSQHDVLLALRRQDGAIVDARVMSDGTLRALAILTALETVPIGSRIILEELDNGVHPSRVSLLLEALWEASKRRSLNILATTHNPAALNSLDAEKLKSVVVCTYDSEISSSRLIPFLQLPRVESFMTHGQLGDAVTSGAIERHLEPDFEEVQRQRSLEWLRTL